jgi:hypothetical protein
MRNRGTPQGRLRRCPDGSSTEGRDAIDQ